MAATKTACPPQRQDPGEPWRSRLRRRWHDLEWPVVAALGLIAVWLGCWGFALSPPPGGEAGTFWGLLYLSLQLFVLQSGSIAEPVSWQLNVARFLAPGVAGYTAYQALAAIFSEEVRLLRLWFARGHVVICGLGRKGWLLAQAFRRQGCRVVAIDPWPENPRIEACRELGVTVLTGDATDLRMLRRARAQRARYLFAVCGADDANAEVAVAARDLALERRGEPLACYVHVYDSQLYARLRVCQGMLQAGGGYRLEFFNILDGAARALLDAHPAAAPEPEAQPHILVVGLGWLGQSLVARAASDRRARYGVGVRPLRVMAVDRHARRQVALLEARLPWLAHVCELTPLELDVSGPEFYRQRFLFDGAGRCRVTGVYVCLDDDALNLTVALELQRRLRDHPVPICVRMREDRGLTTLLHGLEASQAGRASLYAFSLLEQACRPETILDGTCEVIARAIHDAYVRHQAALGFTPETNSSMRPWSELAPGLRESNRLQADHIGTKLAAVRCSVEPLVDWDAAERFEFTLQEVEKLAEMEHERWLEERRSQGWTYAPGTKDLDKKTSPYLVPWSELSEEVREYDRDAVRHLPAALAGAGLQIYRLP